jgi:hypothetical protein
MDTKTAPSPLFAASFVRSSVSEDAFSVHAIALNQILEAQFFPIFMGKLKLQTVSSRPANPRFNREDSTQEIH